jgi:hypothetical protein
MSKRRLIILGCSLSAVGHLKTWGQQVAESCDLEMINLAVPASSNQLQLHRFKEFVIDSTISEDDIIIWEITGIERYHSRRKLNLIEKFIKNSATFCSERKNLFDNEYRYDLLCNHSDAKKNHNNKDFEQLLEDILFHLLVAKQFTNNVIALAGWRMALFDEYYDKFFNILKSKNIEFVEEPILEYSIKNNIPLCDDFHPNEEGYVSYANNCVIPKLKSLNLV